MNNIKSYIIINKKTNLITKLFISISIMILITLSILTQFKYKTYYQTFGQVIKENNNHKLTLYIDPYKLKVIKNNNLIIIDDKKYNYTIDLIDDEYIVSDNLTNYLKVILNVNLKQEDKINNNILEVRILESDEKIIYYLKEYFKKE